MTTRRLIQAMATIAGALWLTMSGVLWAMSDAAPWDVPGPSASAASPVAASPVPETAAVDIARLRYRPFRTVISAGAAVIWTNADGVPHTVTARGAFDSSRLDHGGHFAMTFPDIGRYWYECLYHKDMVGIVVVTE